MPRSKERMMICRQSGFSLFRASERLRGRRQLANLGGVAKQLRQTGEAFVRTRTC